LTSGSTKSTASPTVSSSWLRPMDCATCSVNASRNVSRRLLIRCEKHEIILFVVIPLFFAYNIHMALTRRQKEFLDFLAGFLEKRGYSPSYEEIADGLSLASLATVHKHILALETKNYVTRSFNRSRS